MSKNKQLSMAITPCFNHYRKEKTKGDKLEAERDRGAKELKAVKDRIKERENKENELTEKVKSLQKDIREKVKSLKFV